MKTFKLFAHRRKPATYQILSLKEARNMSKQDHQSFIQIDEGTFPFLSKKIINLKHHVGNGRKEQQWKI